MPQDIIKVLNGILRELQKLNEANSGSTVTYLLNLLTAIATIVAAGGAAVSAFFSKKAADFSKLAIAEQKKESRPFMVIDHVEADHMKDGNLYPVNIYLTNIGKGAARVLVVDLNDDTIRAGIEPPISVGPTGVTHVQILLPEKDVLKILALSVYYWDIDNCCYRTELSIAVKVFFWQTGSLFASYGCFKENQSIIEDKTPPKMVLGWPRTERDYFGYCPGYFHEPWWNNKEDSQV
jgi:hypothetical protein